MAVTAFVVSAETRIFADARYFAGCVDETTYAPTAASRPAAMMIGRLRLMRRGKSSNGRSVVRRSR